MNADVAKHQLARLGRAAIALAHAVDDGQRGRTHDEFQELEDAAIAYGRAVRKTRSRSRRGSSASSTRKAFASSPSLPVRTK